MKNQEQVVDIKAQAVDIGGGVVGASGEVGNTVNLNVLKMPPSKKKQHTVDSFTELLTGKKLFLYGAGRRGKMWEKALIFNGFKIDGLIDVKEKGENVFHPDILEEISCDDVFICISTIDMHVKEIAQKLTSYGFVRDINFISANQLCDAYPTIEIAGVCNLRCMSCNLGSPLEGRKNLYDDRKGGYMSLDEYTKILDKMTKEIPILPFVSLFLYGDPLLNPAVADIIRKSAEFGVSVDVSTNLNFAKYLEEVISASPSFLSIPCSGTKENYELTHTGGHWDVFERNLRLVRKYIDKYNSDTSVQLSYHLYKHNLDSDYDYVRALTEDLGFEFKPVIANLFPERIFQHVAYGKEIPENMKKISETMLYSIEDQINYSKSRPQDDICLKVFPTVRWDGSVVSCYNMEGGEVHPNYLDVSLDHLKKLHHHSKYCTDCRSNNLQRLFFPDDKKELLKSLKEEKKLSSKKDIMDRAELN